jgi:hypothetical protein
MGDTFVENVPQKLDNLKPKEIEALLFCIFFFFFFLFYVSSLLSPFSFSPIKKGEIFIERLSRYFTGKRKKAFGEKIKLDKQFSLKNIRRS